METGNVIMYFYLYYEIKQSFDRVFKNIRYLYCFNKNNCVPVSSMFNKFRKIDLSHIRANAYVL